MSIKMINSKEKIEEQPYIKQLQNLKELTREAFKTDEEIRIEALEKEVKSLKHVCFLIGVTFIVIALIALIGATQ